MTEQLAPDGLKECPFCGGEAANPEPDVNMDYVQCKSCSATTLYVSDWNRRPRASTAGEAELGRFGHHPDPVDDFCVEVDEITGDVYELSVGFDVDVKKLDERIFKAMQFRVGGDASAIAAKDALRDLEKKFKEILHPAHPSATPDTIREALEFYADPYTYFAIGIFPDSPCGDFMDDFSDTPELGVKPGKRAREALAASPWRDIASAPKDGHRYLLSGTFERIPWIHIGHFAPFSGVWETDDSECLYEPSYWMPLPLKPLPSPSGTEKK